VDIILRPDDVWRGMDTETRYRVMDDLITSMEDIGFVLAQSIAADESSGMGV